MSETTGEEMRRPRTWRDWLADHMGIDDEQKLEVYGNLARSATLRDATYWAEIVFAAGIATLGLTLGSPAVIIGAMLISPLMGPIMAAGLALAAGDFILTTRAVTNVIVSCVVAVAFATLLVALLPFREMTSEIAARTQPNTLDLVVALFSGAVGALATTKSLRGVAMSIPGVAIAVALMPPLCVAGYGLGLVLTIDVVQGLAVLRGGMLLFVTNLIAITFSSMLVFLALHVDAAGVRLRIREWCGSDPESATVNRTLQRFALPKEMSHIGSLPARFVIVVTLVASVFVPLKRSFDALSSEITQRHELNAIRRRATDLWQERFAVNASGQARSYIDTIEAKNLDGRTLLTLRVFTSRALSSEERAAYTGALARTLGRDPARVDVTLVEIPTSRFEVASRGRADIAPPPEPPLEQQIEIVRRRATGVLAATPMPAGVTLVDTAVALRGSGAEAVVTYLSPSEMSADAQSLLVRDVRKRLGINGARVSLRWIPQTMRLSSSRRLPADAREEIVAFVRRIVDHPELAVSILAPVQDSRAAARSAPVREAILAAGLPESRIQLLEREEPRNEISLSVTRTLPR
jgi:uncharacterized hydrophobic protein (TIGR00271 family)